MSRYVLLGDVTVAGSGYASPAQVFYKGQVIEASAAEAAAIGSGNLRAVSASTAHDQLGESAGVSNGD